MDSTQKKIVIIIGVILILAGGGAALYFSGALQPAFRLHVTFDDLDGLKVGSPVLFSDYKIGIVEELELTENGRVQIILQINDEHKKLIRKGVLVTVQDDPTSASKRAVHIGLPENAKGNPLLKSGSQIEGVGYWNYKLKMAFGEMKKSFNEISGILLKELDKVEKYFDTPEMQKAFKDVEKFCLELRDASRQKTVELLEKYGPKMRKQAEKLADELERKGYKEEAEALRIKLREDFGEKK